MKKEKEESATPFIKSSLGASPTQSLPEPNPICAPTMLTGNQQGHEKSDPGEGHYHLGYRGHGTCQPFLL